MPVRKLAGLVAIPALLASTTAHAATERPCVSVEENQAFVTYLMPALLTEIGKNCRDEIGSDAYIVENGRALGGRFDAAADAARPAAKRAVERVSDDPLPDSKVALDIGRYAIAAGIADSLEADACDTVSRLTQELAPLPVENFANVFALFLELGVAENDEVPFRVCR